MKINHILTESMLFEQQLREDPIYKNFYSVGRMIVEYKIPQDQIQQIFKAVADGAAAGGNVDKEGDEPVSNRTLLGKGADVASKISGYFDDVKNKISQSDFVQGFDVAVDNIQGKILNAAGGEKGAVGKALAKYREFAHKHPVMQGAIYSGLIALAGISGAGLGGAAILGGIKVFDKLLQGDKASSALWSGFKTGAMAYGASKLGDYIKGQNQQAPANPDDFGAATTSDVTSIAGQPVIPGQPLSDTQMAVMQQSMAAGNTYPPEIMAQYNAQLSGGAGAVAQGAGNAVSGGGVPGQFDGGQYTVMKGDTLGHIAQANGVKVQDLKGLNPQIDFSKALQPGMNIELPPAGDNAGSVWQGYTGGTYGDQAASVAKGAGDMATQQNFVLPADSVANNEIVKAANAQAWLNADDAERLDIEQTTGMSAEKLQSIVDTNKLQPGTSPNDAALDIQSRLNTGPGPVPSDAADQVIPGQPEAGAKGLRAMEPSAPPRGANMSPDYLQKVVSGEHPRPMISADQAQKALDWQAQNGGQAGQAAADNALLGGNTPVSGGNGFSKEYLQRAADPNRVGRYMISVEKAKQLLNQSYVNPKPMLEYIDRDATVRSWVLRESMGRPRGGVALTEAGRQAVFRAVVNEGPTWDAIKSGAGKFAKGLGQGFTNPGVRNIKNMDASQMAGAQVGAVGNKLATGYGKLAGMVQKGADAVGGVVKKGWDSATNKITYDKLDLNWRKNYKEFDPTGGKGPVDSEAVADFLRKQGVKDGLISSVYKQLNIPLAAAAGADAAAKADDGATATGATGGATGGSGVDTGATGATGGATGAGKTDGQAADEFIANLIAGYKALTPPEQLEIRNELQSILATASKAAAAESVNRALSGQFKKLTTESIHAWLESNAGRSSSKRLQEAALYEISYRKAKLKKRYK